MLFDAHNHLQDEWLRPHLDHIATDLAAAGVAGAVVNGTCEADWPVVAALATRFPWVRPSYGLHPWDVGNASPQWREVLLRTLDAHPRAALGEIGLDRWILERARPNDPRLAGLRRAPLDEQMDAFLWQLRIAAERNLPVSIHCLDAWGPLADALRQTPLPARGFLLHAYGGSAEMARNFTALGAFFSFNGAFLPPSERHVLSDTMFLADSGSNVSRHVLSDTMSATDRASNVPRHVIRDTVFPAGSGSNVSRHVIRDTMFPAESRASVPRHVIRDTARARRHAEVFATIPRDRLLLETDAPAMPLPLDRQSHRLPDLAGGTRINHPANIAAAYAGLAEILGLPLATLAAQVADNFQRLFGK